MDGHARQMIADRYRSASVHRGAPAVDLRWSLFAECQLIDPGDRHDYQPHVQWQMETGAACGMLEAHAPQQEADFGLPKS